MPRSEYDVKLKGNQARVTGRADVAGSGAVQIDTIVTADKIYSKMPTQVNPSCPWLVADKGAPAGGTSDPTESFSGPQAEFICSSGAFADSAFTPDGNACTMAEITGGTAGIPTAQG
jgi:hypothetical protein